MSGPPRNRNERCKRDHEPNWFVGTDGHRRCRDCRKETYETQRLKRGSRHAPIVAPAWGDEKHAGRGAEWEETFTMESIMKARSEVTLPSGFAHNYRSTSTSGE